MTRRKTSARALVQEAFAQETPGQGVAPEAQLLDALAMSAALAPLTAPPPRLKQRLMEAIRQPQLAFFDRVAQLLQIGLDEARQLLESFDNLDERGLWEEGGAGIWLRHLNLGPRFSQAVVGLVRVEPGVAFPHHVHLGIEHVLVLQGGLRDISGAVSLPGDLVIMPAESGHTFEALPGDELRYLAVVQHGVDFRASGGPLLLPDGKR